MGDTWITFFRLQVAWITERYRYSTLSFHIERCLITFGKRFFNTVWGFIGTYYVNLLRQSSSFAKLYKTQQRKNKSTPQFKCIMVPHTVRKLRFSWPYVCKPCIKKHTRKVQNTLACTVLQTQQLSVWVIKWWWNGKRKLRSQMQLSARDRTWGGSRLNYNPVEQIWVPMLALEPATANRWSCRQMTTLSSFASFLSHVLLPYLLRRNMLSDIVVKFELGPCKDVWHGPVVFSS